MVRPGHGDSGPSSIARAGAAMVRPGHGDPGPSSPADAGVATGVVAPSSGHAALRRPHCRRSPTGAQPAVAARSPCAGARERPLVARRPDAGASAGHGSEAGFAGHNTLRCAAPASSSSMGSDHVTAQYGRNSPSQCPTSYAARVRTRMRALLQACNRTIAWSGATAHSVCCMRGPRSAFRCCRRLAVAAMRGRANGSDTSQSLECIPRWVAAQRW